MQNRSASDECYDDNCLHNVPYMRPHYHVMTNDGGYVRFIVEKPKQKEYDDL